MKKRETPREVPDAAHYLRVEVDTNGTHVFRIPSMAKARVEVTKARGALREDEEAVKQASMLLLSGAFIGECWFHPEWDLETVRGRMSIEDYGCAIHEELHEAGYSSAEIARLVSEVSVALSAKAMARDDIDSAKAFFARTVEAGTGSATSSPPASAETSEHGAT